MEDSPPFWNPLFGNKWFSFDSQRESYVLTVVGARDYLDIKITSWFVDNNSLSGQVEVRFNNSLTFASSNELPFDTCSIPPLPRQRTFHSQSLLSGETMVVCGGRDDGFYSLDSCTSWVAGNTSWTHFYNMRCLTIVFSDAQPNLKSCDLDILSYRIRIIN